MMTKKNELCIVVLFCLFQRGCVFQVKFSKLHLNLTSGAQGFLYNNVTRDFEE